MNKRVVCWFSCGAASAVAAKVALQKYSKDHEVVVVYCDTSASEHPDNMRFMADIERFLGVEVVRIKGAFDTVEECFGSFGFMAGPKGARCTTEMKKIPRFKFQRYDDIHVFGFTADEVKRIRSFDERNPDLTLDWVLFDAGVTKTDCLNILRDNGIELPTMYKLGFKNNNCIGCVKASSPGYWNKVRDIFPEVFERRAAQSREIGARLVRVRGVRIFLDELDPNERGRMENISCGPECGQTGRKV